MDPLKNGKLLYLFVAGSGPIETASESSDYDYRGVVIPDPLLYVKKWAGRL
jgi:predicted nucleotidyltransferase